MTQPEKGDLTVKVDQLFHQWNRPDSPGAAVGVIKDGSVIHMHGYGMANLDYDIPIFSSSVFDVGSESKQFTAMAILLLAKEGKLSLDDDIQKHLPDVPTFGRQITLRHLICHTSGLRDYLSTLVIGGWRYDDVFRPMHALRAIENQQAPNFEPGEEYFYSNTGYFLLAEIVTKVSNQSLREYTEANIFRPLGMANSQFGDDHTEIIKGKVESYAPHDNGRFKRSVNNTSAVGAGGLQTTVDDLVKWVLNFETGQVGGHELLAAMEEQGVLNNGEVLDYACGLRIGQYRGLKTISHGGSWRGYRSYILRFPRERVAVIVLANLSVMKPVPLCRQVADIVLADRFPEPAVEMKSPDQAVDVDPSIYDDYIGIYQTPGTRIIEVIKENNSLFVHTLGEKVEIFPESGSTFFMTEYPDTVTFERNTAGYIAHYTSRVDDKSEPPRKRIAPSRIEVDDLTEFEGKYYSSELEAMYTMCIQEGILTARHRRHGDTSLTPVIEDLFEGPYWFHTVRFRRDNNGQVLGFDVSVERARNLRFDKLTDVHV